MFGVLRGRLGPEELVFRNYDEKERGSDHDTDPVDVAAHLPLLWSCKHEPDSFRLLEPCHGQRQRCYRPDCNEHRVVTTTRSVSAITFAARACVQHRTRVTYVTTDPAVN